MAFALDNILYTLQFTHLFIFALDNKLFTLQFTHPICLGQYTLHSTVYICLYLDNILYTLQFTSVYT